MRQTFKRTPRTKYFSEVEGTMKSYNTAKSISDIAEGLFHRKKQATTEVRDSTGMLVENYIYLYHIPGDNSSETGQFVIIPTWPESYTDSLSSTFASENILARSAPIFAYSYSGPRSITITIALHRDMMTQLNYGVSNLKLEIGDDYVDTIINKLQAMALPKYDYGSKLVNPPMIAVRFGNEFFIKGVVNGGVNVTGTLPVLSNGKYSQMGIQFTVTEVDPYDAETVVNQGSMRGLSTSLERNLYKS